MHDFLAVDLAGVGQLDLHGQRAFCVDLIRRLHATVDKAGVAQAKAEGELRRLRGVAIGASGHAVLLEGRKLIQRAREGERQLARRGCDAKENVGHGPTALLPRIPHEENGVGQVGDIAQGDGAAAGEHEHDARSVGLQLAQIVGLHRGQPDLGAIAGGGRLDGVAFLALHLRRETHAGNHHVRAGGGHGRPRAGVGRHVQQQRAGAILEAHALWCARHDALDECGQRIRETIVVAHQHLGTGRGRAEHVETAQVAQGQDIAGVLEQYDRLERGLVGKLAVSVAVDDAFRNARIGHHFLRVEHTQLEARRVDARDRAVDVALAEQPAVQRLAQVLEGLAALEVAAALDGKGRALGAIGRDAVRRVQVVERPAVGDDVSPKAPGAAQDVHKQQLAGTTRLAIGAVVSAHDRLNLGLGHQLLEGGQVGRVEIARRDLGVELVALALRPAVDGIVLGARRTLEIARVIALQAAHEGRAHRAGEEGILAPRFLAAAPARVAEDIDIGRPEGEPLVVARLAIAAQRGVILGAPLVADGGGDLLDQRRIPRGGHADGLREDGGAAVAGNAVQRLAPPVVGRDPQPRDGRCVEDKLAEFLFERHAADEIGDAVGKRLRRIEKERGTLRVW